MSATLFVRHPVEDYAAWRSVYDSDSLIALREQHGVTADEVHVDPSDKTDVFIIHRFPTVEQAQAFASSTGLKEAMHRAGVVGAPRVEITAEG